MSIFKTACRVLLAHKVYIFVYVVLLGMMGVFVASGSTQSVASDAFEQGRASVAIIDRDGSDLSKGLTRAMADYTTIVEVADDTQACQDAVAQNKVNCLFIVPEGFGAQFMEAARAGQEPPVVSTVTSFDDIGGFEAENQLQMYLSCVALRAAADAQATQAHVASAAHEDMAHTSSAAYAVEEGEASPLPGDYLLYNLWSAYPIICSIGVLVATMMAGFNRLDLRRRNHAAPVSSLRLSLGLAGAAVVAAAAVWVWTVGLGLVAFSGSLAGVEVWRIVACVICLAVFSLFALSFGFLLAQLGASEVVANSVSNIGGLVLSFLGGVWIDPSLMGPTLETVGSFTPLFWYNKAVTFVAQAEQCTWDALLPAAQCAGVVLLFAVALFAVAFAVGRARLSAAGVKAAQR